MVKKPASPGTARQMEATADASHARTSGTLVHRAAKSPAGTPFKPGRVAKKLTGQERGSFR